MAWPITAATKASLRSAHTVKTTVLIDAGGSTPIYTADLIGGSVDMDGSSLVRTTVSLTLSPAAWTEAKRWPLVAARVEINYGVGALDSATPTVLIPFGKLFVEKVSRSVPGGAVQVECSDFMRFIEYSAIRSSSTFGPALTYKNAIVSLASPNPFSLFWDPSSDWSNDRPLPPTFYLDKAESRFYYLEQLLDTLNLHLWVNRSSMFEVQRLDAYSATPVWDIDAGATGVLLSSDDERSGEQTRNEIKVVSTPADGSIPLTVYVEDVDPSSPTYTGGLFGRRTYTRSSGFLTDQASMIALGRSLLIQQLGLSRSLRASIPPAPHLDPGDVVSLTLPGEFPELRRIASVSIDLTGGATNVVLVEHRV